MGKSIFFKSWGPKILYLFWFSRYKILRFSEKASIPYPYVLNDKTLGGRDLAPSAVTGEGNCFVWLL